MNVLFMTMVNLREIHSSGIYSDLMRHFRDSGHEVYIVTPRERRLKIKTNLSEVDGVHILGVKTLNVQKTNLIEKGIGQLLLEPLFKCAIKQYFSNVKFDLILFSTPPITFTNVIAFLRKENPLSKTYLLLKDIFPQNAVDLGLINQKGVLYKFFRKKEKKLYKISDYIGCMSPANVRYVIDHNPDVNPAKVELAPNSVDVNSILPPITQDEKNKIRQKYNLPIDKPIFIYGGNLGKPQGVPHLIKCLEANCHRDDCHFVVIGTGTELSKLKEWERSKEMTSVTIMNGLPKKEYDELVSSCDVGLIFLDYHFSIPNYPSRLLAYLAGKKPIITCTDPNSDIGTIAEQNGYGFSCLSNEVLDFTKVVDKMLVSDINGMGLKGFDFLCQNYLIDSTYNAIMNHFEHV